MQAKIAASGQRRNFHLRKEPPHSDNPAVPTTARGLGGAGDPAPWELLARLSSVMVASHGSDCMDGHLSYKASLRDAAQGRRPSTELHGGSAFLLAPAPSKLGQKRAPSPSH